jgi:hypothetical protein
MAILSDLCFDPRIKFVALVSDRFGCSVCPSDSSSHPFQLVVSFGHSEIRLNHEYVSLILQACLGGIAKDLEYTICRVGCLAS